MTDSDPLRETLARLAERLDEVLAALERHATQLTRHEQLLETGRTTDATAEAISSDLMALTGTKNVADARKQILAWKASHEREAELLHELQEASDPAAPSAGVPAKQRPSQGFGVPQIDLRHSEIEAEIIQLIPREIAERYQCLPLLRLGRSGLVVAMSEPVNVSAVAELERLVGFKIELMAAHAQALQEAIAKYYPAE